MIEVRCVTSQKEFASLEVEWNELLKRSAANSLFLTHQWLYSWWQAFSDRACLFLLLCYEQTSNGESLIGIFPGYVKKSGLCPPAHRLRLLGSEVVTSDFLDVVVEKGREEEVLRELVKEFRISKAFHLVELTDLREDSPLLQMRRENSESEYCFHEWPVTKLCPVIPLPATTEEYFSGLSKSVRKNFQYYRRKLEAQGAILEIIQKNDDLPLGIQDFTRLHNARRGQKNQSGIFSTAAQKLFYNDVFGRLFDAGWLELAFLNISGERIAGVCQFNYGESSYYYQTGYDIAWEKSSVGFVLNVLLIERAIDQGKSFYEFLRGVEEYKYRLGATSDRHLSDIYLRNGSLMGDIFLAKRHLGRSVKEKAKVILQPFLGNRLTDGKVCP
ncbi:GNAT family N-acetyltransferase [Desulfopila sp. IMCC35006]|uniref:GNAT family N-acetyltransferase n=1 Tax=Desulfopila sp. IMCC35006 TaxID=2569542 RepID=UPI0010ACF957|nr:GNAT family N-acetyltransferase [Desulfopila sp. IMCC35006]TKB23963.1 GNAT family N-acetyltransferase [Desulfopila sp. IMCC35006]